MSKACGCGCGNRIPEFDSRGRQRVYVRGHGTKRSLPELKYRKIYRSWSGMKTRCLNPNNFKYKDYGGRGITICPRWFKFDNFYKDMQGSWEEGLSIDRVDNSRGYYKENCQWSNDFQQANNKRNSRVLTYNGVSKTLSEWARDLGLNQSTLSMRYHTYRWSVEECLTQRRRNGHITR